MATLAEVRDFWNRNPCLNSYLHEEYGTHNYFEEGWNLRYKYHYHIPESISLLQQLKPNGKVLEIGTGIGCDTLMLCQHNFDVYGIDLTPKAVEVTKDRLRHYNQKANINIGNAEKLEFENETFDAVYSFGVLHHTPDTQQSIDEVRRVLKPGGIALIMLYNKISLNYFAHFLTNTQFDGTKKDACPIERAYTKRELNDIFSKFSNVEIKIEYLFGTGWKAANYFIPEVIKRELGKAIGWHHMIYATK